MPTPTPIRFLRFTRGALHNPNRIRIPRLPHAHSSSSSTEGGKSEYQANKHPHPQTAAFLPHDGAASLKRHQQLASFGKATHDAAEQVWRDGKTHLRKQKELIKELGVDGAVRETLTPTRTSFRETLRQRPLDKGILEEIYRGLHGKRIERQLKRGVSWEHWITKGDGTAPVYTTSQKSQQTFAFGGHIKQIATASHPHQFPVVYKPGASPPPVPSSHNNNNNGKNKKNNGKKHKAAAPQVDRELLLPEVAFIGRTSSGKSSLINALVNSMITPYGHLQGTTSTVRFYNVADRITIVDCPGYGYYNPMGTPALDAENAVKTMRAYLRTGEASTQRAVNSSNADHNNNHIGEKNKKTKKALADEEFDGEDSIDGNDHDNKQLKQRLQRRNIKRVFVCVPARGLQHMDLEYCRLLENLGIPFAVVLCKTDAAQIRFLARLADHTRCQLVQFKQCKELMLASSLRLAGISEMQNLVASMAVTSNKLNGASMDFSSIV